MHTLPAEISADDRRAWVAATLALVGLGIAVRLVLNFSHTYPPGTDAAYYP